MTSGGSEEMVVFSGIVEMVMVSYVREMVR